MHLQSLSLKRGRRMEGMDADDARMESRWDGMHGNLQESTGNTMRINARVLDRIHLHPPLFKKVPLKSLR